MKNLKVGLFLLASLLSPLTMADTTPAKALQLTKADASEFLRGSAFVAALSRDLVFPAMATGFKKDSKDCTLVILEKPVSADLIDQLKEFPQKDSRIQKELYTISLTGGSGLCPEKEAFYLMSYDKRTKQAYAIEFK